MSNKNTNNRSKSEGFSKPQTVLPAAGGTGAIPDTVGQQGSPDPKLEKQNIKNRIQVLKEQQKDTERSIKGLEKQLSRLSSPVKKSKKEVVNKKKNKK